MTAAAKEPASEGGGRQPMPYERDTHPLPSFSARIMRGFKRIGIGAAVLMAMLGVTVTTSVAVNTYNNEMGWSDVLSQPAHIPASRALANDIELAPRERDEAAFHIATTSALIGLGITAAACLAVFGFFRGLGWVIAGFARD
jgi:hypothetical protein